MEECDIMGECDSIDDSSISETYTPPQTQSIASIFDVFKTPDVSGSSVTSTKKARNRGGVVRPTGQISSALPQSPKLPAPTLPTPTGYSQKDIPVVSLKFTTLGRHPLSEKRIWGTKMENGIKIYFLDMKTVDSFKGDGSLNISGFPGQVLPHPTIPNLVVSSSDFEDGFVLDDNKPDEIKYWLIRCKESGIYMRLNNT
jgi:hypothetical protein